MPSETCNLYQKAAVAFSRMNAKPSCRYWLSVSVCSTDAVQEEYASNSSRKSTLLTRHCCDSLSDPIGSQCRQASA